MPLPSPHVLYEAAVQGVGYDVDFITRVFRRFRGRAPRLLREDFCGTAALACEWVAQDPRRRAWGVDVHGPTLAWAARERLPLLGEARRRVTLIRSDVRAVTRPRVDALTALNCSYWVFQRRDALLGYFRIARSSLRPDGLLFLDLFGGEGAATLGAQRRSVRSRRDHSGRRVPPFTYVWEQEAFNPVDHRLVSHIHFERLPGGRALRRAFTYDWRLWSAPELREILADAGFSSSHLYVQGWDDERNEPRDVFQRRVRFENQEGWLAYLVAER